MLPMYRLPPKCTLEIFMPDGIVYLVTHAVVAGLFRGRNIFENFADLLLCTKIIIIREYCVPFIRCVDLKPNADLVVEDECPHKTQDQLEVPTHNVSTACREWEDKVIVCY